MEKITSTLNELKLGDKLGYLKQSSGFSTRAIHIAQEPERWKSR